MEELARDQWYVDRKAWSSIYIYYLLTSTTRHAMLYWDK